MDKFLIRKDVYDDLIEKGYGKRDLSKLTKKQITDKNGHKRTVYVKNGEQPVTQKQTKTDELTPEKKARYEEMLEKVKRGPEENALFVRGEMLNKKDAISYLELKLGRRNGVVAEQKMKMEDEKKNAAMRDSQMRKKPTVEEYKENYFDAKNEAGKDIAENNKINKVSDLIEFSSDEMKAIQDAANKIGYKPGEEGKLLNAIEDKNIYSSLTKKNSDAWKRSGKEQKTFSSTDLLKEKIKAMNLKVDSGKKTESENKPKEYEEMNEQELQAELDKFGRGPFTRREQIEVDRIKDFLNKVKTENQEDDETSAKTFEDAIKNYNFNNEKKQGFAMDEVAKFYPELKDIVAKRRAAFSKANDARKRLDINPNNETYKEDFRNAANELSKLNKEYESQAEKALEKAPDVPKPSFGNYMDARRTVEQMKDKYKKQLESYEIANRLRANGAAAILDPMYGLKPDDYTKDSGFINAQMTIRAYEGK